MYLSFDEACTHVGASAFRLVAGIYDRKGARLLATTVSPPIRSVPPPPPPLHPASAPLRPLRHCASCHSPASAPAPVYPRHALPLSPLRDDAGAVCRLQQAGYPTHKPGCLLSSC